jgi:hypothetical protein
MRCIRNDRILRHFCGHRLAACFPHTHTCVDLQLHGFREIQQCVDPHLCSTTSNTPPRTGLLAQVIRRYHQWSVCLRLATTSSPRASTRPRTMPSSGVGEVSFLIPPSRCVHASITHMHGMREGACMLTAVPLGSQSSIGHATCCLFAQMCPSTHFLRPETRSECTPCMVILCVLIPEPRSLDFTPQSPFVQPPLRQPHLVDFTPQSPFVQPPLRQPHLVDFTPQSPFVQPPLRQPHLVDFTRDLPFALASINRSLRSLFAQEPLRRAPWHVCLGDRDYISNPTAQVCSNSPTRPLTHTHPTLFADPLASCRVVSCRAGHCKREVNGRTRCMQPINTSLRWCHVCCL